LRHHIEDSVIRLVESRSAFTLATKVGVS
jgi:hypothetical protein